MARRMERAQPTQAKGGHRPHVNYIMSAGTNSSFLTYVLNFHQYFSIQSQSKHIDSRRNLAGRGLIFLAFHQEVLNGE
jgi:hypothetical protein